MKVLIYYPDDLDKPTGTRNRIINVADALANYHEVYLAAPSMRNRPHKYHFVKINHITLMAQFSKFFNFLNTLKLVKKIKPDIIYSFIEVSLPTMLLPAKLYHVPHIIEIHSIWIEDIATKYTYYVQGGIIYKILDFLVTKMLQKTDHQLIGCVPLRDYYGKKLKNMTLMPPSINTHIFNEKIKPNKKITEIKNKTKKIIVTYAGNFHSYQGSDLLLDVIKSLDIKHIDDFIFILIGNAPNEFKQKVKDLGLDSKVIFLGVVPYDQIASYLRASDILVIPRLDIKTTRFAFPSKPLEYLAVGRCVISTKTWPSEELITHMKTGLLVDANVDDFINKLLIAKNKNLRENIGKNSAKLIKENYSVDNDAKKLTDIFATLVKKTKV